LKHMVYFLILVSVLMLPAEGGAESNSGLLRLPYPKEFEGYRPKALLATADGFLLGGEALRPGTGWDISFIRLSLQLILKEQKLLAGDRTDDLVGIRALDSGYVFLANTSSRTGVLRALYGIQDMNLLRLNRKGEVLWSAVLGGGGLNQAKEVVVNEGNGAVTVLGSVNRVGGAIPKTHGDLDVTGIVARYNQSGQLQWVTVLGGEGDDIPGNLVVDGERTWVLYSGWSRRDRWHMYLVQLDGAGKEVRRIECGGRALAADLARLDDGDLLLLGTTDSEDDRYGKPRGKTDILLMRISERGRVRWQKRFGGSEDDLAHSLLIGQGGECWVLGTTWSGDGDVGRHMGGSDIWLLRVGSKGELLDSQVYGTADDDMPLQILQGMKRPLVLGATRVSDDLAEPFLIVPSGSDDSARSTWH